MIEPQRQLDRLTLFAFMWAWAETMQPLNTHAAMTSWAGLLLPLFTIALILRPGSTRLLIAFLIASLSRTMVIMPFVPNHILFMALVNLTLLTAIVQQALRQRSWQVDRKAVYECFSVVARWQLVLLYLFAALAKLNWDYLNPEVSSATALFDGVTSIFAWLPQNHLTEQTAIYGSIALEIVIPVLLLFRRTRLAGIGCAVAFHMVLSIHPLWATSILTFTMMIFAMLVLFASDRMLDWFFQRIGQSQRLAKAWLVLAYLVTVTAVLVTVFPRSIDHSFDKIRMCHTIAFVPHFVSCVVLSGLAAYYCGLRSRTIVGSATSNRRPTPVFGVNVCWLVLVLTFFNGCCPYAGLKTTTAFTMFSNLRTEGQLDNHLFLPDGDWFEYQRHLVRVLDSDDPLLAPYVETGDMITLFELRRICARDYESPPNRTYTLNHDVRHHMFARPRRPAGNHYVRYRLNGREYSACRNQDNKHCLFRKLPWYREKFLAFRPVCAPGQPAPCDH
ncbi:MAG: hypothetical protein ACR2NP_14830 [Pirellulaceae bacterium]